MQQIILADNQVIFRAGAARVLAAEAEFRLVAQCVDLHGLQGAIEQHPGAMVVFSSGIAAELSPLLDVLDAAGSRSILILERGAELQPCVAARVAGVLSRSVAGADLVECVRRVSRGERCVVVVDAEPVLPHEDRAGSLVLSRLTPKELQILALVSAGGKNRDIATQLNTTEQVIKNYLFTIYEKTGVSDRLELALFTRHHPALAEAAERVRQTL